MAVMKKIIVLLALFSMVAFAQQKGSFTDPRDGKMYNTVKMPDGKTWMAENLDYAGRNKDIGVCFGNIPVTCEACGALYDWKEAMEVCPSGWHLPSTKEWNVLIKFAGGTENVQKKLKTNIADFWDNWINNRGETILGRGTDNYGFAALSCGYGTKREHYNLDNWSVEDDYDFNNAGKRGFWWSATEYYAFSICNNHNTGMSCGSVDSYSSESFLFSVRCVRN